jgi:hypothetical protein
MRQAGDSEEGRTSFSEEKEAKRLSMLGTGAWAASRPMP